MDMLSGDDKEILKKILAQDSRATYSFYMCYKKPLLSFIMKMVNDRNDAEEVLQDSFVAFFESLRSFREQSSLKTYLFAIAKHRSIDKLRRRKLKRVLFSCFPEGVVDGFKTVLLDDELDKRALAKSIKRAFSLIPKDYAHIIRLKYLEGDSVKDIARKMSITDKAAESMLFRARKSFAKSYTKL